MLLSLLQADGEASRNAYLRFNNPPAIAQIACYFSYANKPKASPSVRIITFGKWKPSVFVFYVLAVDEDLAAK